MKKIKAKFMKGYEKGEEKIISFKNSFITKKRNGNEGVITAVVLIAVAVAVCIIFKGAIITFVTDCVKTLTDKTKTIFG